MTMSVKTEPLKTSGPQECAGCGKKIQDRYLLKALDMYWHEDCLKCGCCDCRLGEVGSTLYTKGNLILCKRDYLRLFGTTGYCAACNKVIPAFEMVMRARTNVYHLECFACQQCNHRFCVGDRFFLCDNKILCEYDYEERMVFANLAYNSSNMAQIKQQARSVSGNGIPAKELANGMGNGIPQQQQHPPPPHNGMMPHHMNGCGPSAPTSASSSMNGCGSSMDMCPPRNSIVGMHMGSNGCQQQSPSASGSSTMLTAANGGVTPSQPPTGPLPSMVS